MNLVSIGFDNRLWPNRRQAIFETNADLSLNEYRGTNLSEIWIIFMNSFPNFLTFSLKKMRLKMSSATMCFVFSVFKKDSTFVTGINCTFILPNIFWITPLHISNARLQIMNYFIKSTRNISLKRRRTTIRYNLHITWLHKDVLYT